MAFLIAGGFVLGFLLKQTHIPLWKMIYFNFKDKKQKFYILAKINDKELFDVLFPETNASFRTQPMWDFYKNKLVIKIEVENTFNFSNPVSYDNFLDNTGLDIEFFKSFSELFIYIHYFIDNQEYINVYEKEMSITTNDFVINETTVFKKFNSIVRATFHANGKETHITEYFKKFLNNHSLRTEHLLLYYDQLDRQAAILETTVNQIKLYSLKEKI